VSRWHNVYEDGHVHFVTYTVCHWQPLLDEQAVKCLYGQWKHNGQRFGVAVLAYVVMPDHVHMLLWSERGESVMRFLQRTLGETSKAMRPGVGKFWKERPRVFPVFTRAVIDEKLAYIHDNPVEARLVVSPDEWRHSSYRQVMLGEDGGPYACDPFPW
jgi:REP element-mobilizing transposase RayT